MEIKKWKYTVIRKDGDLETNYWETSLSASKICEIFESVGAEVIELKIVKSIPAFYFLLPIKKKYRSAGMA